MRSVALLTPAHSKDIERFDLLCESMDKYVSGYERHYVIVNDDERPLFARYAGPRRIITPAFRFLPSWLWAAPPFLARNGQRVWLSLLSKPIQGWQVQQLLKIGGTLAASEERICIVDSGNLFFRPFDVGAYAGVEKTPLYVKRLSIRHESPKQAVLTRNAHELLGLPEPLFPADDHAGNLIAWDRATLAAMTEEIRLLAGVDWRIALCRKRKFSEYQLYGNFVSHAPHFRERHDFVEKSLAIAYWDENHRDESGVRAFMEKAEPHIVALCNRSCSQLAPSEIRSAIERAHAA